ncbi:MAG TPA: hypothetical protein VHM25_05155, partial [Polyangiaceae bacterium]|nr:hypothetical protein [Polyangiaceae bacterium]
IPACPVSQACVIEEGDRFRCVDMLGAGPLSAPTPTTSAPASSAPASSAAPASSVAPPISSAPLN